ncbi:hypothetical protein [Aeromonas aquatica]|uniref:hypothetical protein n=1 Tax=Aeromonas aquatica TaxID=558964 RepID=UPI00068A5DA6|nr:hypothetical protein [Aeromonas aquatica]
MMKTATGATDRKKAQRKRDKDLGIKRIEIRLSAAAMERLEQSAAIRGGVTGPYELPEYVELLITQDADRLALHIEQLSKAPCGKCGNPLPGGCGGIHKGEHDCAHTREARQLMLTEPPFMTEAELDALLAKRDEK